MSIIDMLNTTQKLQGFGVISYVSSPEPKSSSNFSEKDNFLKSFSAYEQFTAYGKMATKL